MWCVHPMNSLCSSLCGMYRSVNCPPPLSWKHVVSLHELPLSWVNLVCFIPWTPPIPGKCGAVHSMNSCCPRYMRCASFHELLLSWVCVVRFPPWTPIWPEYIRCVSLNEFPLSRVLYWSVFSIYVCVTPWAYPPFPGYICSVLLHELLPTWVHVVCLTPWTLGACDVFCFSQWPSSVLGTQGVLHFMNSPCPGYRYIGCTGMCFTL